MPGVFTPRANFIARASLAGAGLTLLGVGVVAYAYTRSSYATGVGVEIEQPVPFSHEHHVSGLGMDCRYCHTTVEESAFAGMPATQTCMHCHERLWTDAALLAPVRESWRTRMPISWQRVHDLPDFAYFNHAVHLAKGIGCVSCHGRVDRMRLMRKEATLFMQWCLDCHRNPAPHLRPKDKLFDMAWEPGPEDAARQAALMSAYDIRLRTITDCTTCHR